MVSFQGSTLSFRGALCLAQVSQAATELYVSLILGHRNLAKGCQCTGGPRCPAVRSAWAICRASGREGAGSRTCRLAGIPGRSNCWITNPSCDFQGRELGMQELEVSPFSHNGLE